MRRRSWIARWAVAAAVFALVLRAGIPLLAAGAASLRGVAVADVCEVYGVALAGAAAQPHAEHGGHAGHEHAAPWHADQGSHSGSEHTDGHCALTALTALGALAVSTPAIAGPRAMATMVQAAGPQANTGHDAAARWAARLQHGPPAVV